MTDPRPALSVVIPAFNEARRLPATLERLTAVLDAAGVDWELVLVDDGSTDGTAAWMAAYERREPRARALRLPHNRGRGAAVRTGMLAARGVLVVETDADGSTDHEAILRFAEHLEAHPAVDAVFGSRNAPGSRRLARQPRLRELLGDVFVVLARVLLRARQYHDFSLGFKMFRRRMIEDVFSRQRGDRYVAEAEIIYIALRRGWRGVELPVMWTDDPDTRVRKWTEAARSFWNLLQVVLWDLQGRYR